MSPQLLNLINDMARMQQLAEKGDWAQFQPLEANWLERFKQVLAEETELDEAQKAEILKSLLQQVDVIQRAVENAMLKLKQDHLQQRQKQQALSQYFE